MTAAEYGDPRLPARFWAKARETESGCWEWTGHRNRSGYGQFSAGGRAGGTMLAHRHAYAALVGSLPPYVPGGLQLDHLCRRRACVNPAHLELVSQRENLLRGDTIAADHASRTHCPRGHELAGANLVPAGLARGWRECLACRGERVPAAR